MKIIFGFIVMTLLGYALLPLVAGEHARQSKTPSLSQSPLSSIELIDHDNHTFRLESLKGKTVVLNFMFNGCSPVQTVALRRAYLDHKLNQEDKNIVFLSISVATETDTPEQLKQFSQRYGIYSKNWRIALTDQPTLDALLDMLNAGIPPEKGQIGHLNTVFLFDTKGQLGKRYVGYPISPSLIFDDLAKSIVASS